MQFSEFRLVTYLIAFVLGWLLTYLMAPLVQRLAIQVGFVDLPSGRKKQTKPVALGGSRGREAATGRGVVYVLQQLCRDLGRDPKTMRVHGMDGLRVVDASVMPQATAGDLNVPTLMLAERAADLIRGTNLPAADPAPVMVDENWQSRQRSGAIDMDLSGKDTGALFAEERNLVGGTTYQ